MSELKAHSDIGASSLYRWAACPGSVKLAKGIANTDSPYAAEGTLAHYYASEILNTGKLPKPWPKEFPDMEAAVMEFVKLIRSEFADDKDIGDILLIEHRFHLKEVHPDAFGTADVVMYKHRARTLKVFDYKHGIGHVVSVRNNSQLKYYALGALLSMPKLKPLIIESIIVQPRAYHEEGAVRREENKPLDLLDFAADLTGFIEATMDPNAPLKAGEHCHFCPVKPFCPLLEKTAMNAAKNEFNVADAQDTLVGAYDVRKLAHTLSVIPGILAYIKGVEEFAYNEAQKGVQIPNYKLVATRAQRKWADENAVGQRLAQRFNQTVIVQCRTEPTLKSPAQIETIVGKKVFGEMMADLVVKVSSGTKLVEESDSGAAIIKGSEFNAITHNTLQG